MRYSIPLKTPIYRAHENRLPQTHAQGPVNAYFEALLETGVDEMAWDDVGDDNVSFDLPSRAFSPDATL